MAEENLEWRKFKMNKNRSEFLKMLKSIALVTICILALLATVSAANINKQRQKAGEQAVKLMYQFVDLQQLQLNMIDLKAITTKPVFNQLTIDNEDRSMYTYMKFKGTKTSVKITKATSTYVLYSIENDNIDSDRKFIFMFDCDKTGKISYVREAEINDFVSYYN